jgi:plasmid replication initiation protein
MSELHGMDYVRARVAALAGKDSTNNVAAQTRTSTASRTRGAGSKRTTSTKARAAESAPVEGEVLDPISPAPIAGQIMEEAALVHAMPRRKKTADLGEQLDFFPIKLVDAPLKNDLASMEHPFFSLSKTPDLNIRHYEHNNNSITITPSGKGMATIWDKDVLLYAASALSDELNRGGKVSRTIRLRAHDLLRYTGRGLGKDAYDRLQEAFERLAGTRIKTDITTGGTRKRSGFGLLESWKIVERAGSGKMDAIEMVVPEWFIDSVLSAEVLTMNHAYFKLKGGLERRFYEIARKHVGKQPKWTVSVATLLKKSGSRTNIREFRRGLRAVCAANALPDYTIELDEKSEIVTLRPRAKEPIPTTDPVIPPER